MKMLLLISLIYWALVSQFTIPLVVDKYGREACSALNEIFMPEEDHTPDRKVDFGLSYNRNKNNFAVFKENEDMYSNGQLQRAKYPHIRRTKKRAASKPDPLWTSKDGSYQLEHRAFLPKRKIIKKNRRIGSIFANAPKFRLPSFGSKNKADTVAETNNTTSNKEQLKETVDSNVDRQSDKIIDEVTKASHELRSTDKNETPEEYNMPIDVFDENLNTDDEIKEHEANNNSHEHVNSTGTKLIKLLDQVEEELQNTQIDSSEKRVIHAKIIKIINNVGNKPKDSIDPMPYLDFSTGFSEGEFETKKGDGNEETLLFPILNQELHEYNEKRPTYQYRDEINIANSDKLEAVKFKQDDHSSYYPEDVQSIVNKLYHKDKYTKYDTESDYETDLLDEERRKFYQDKLEEFENKHLYLANGEYQKHGEDMEDIQSDRAEPETLREHLPDEEERLAASRFYNHKARALHGNK